MNPLNGLSSGDENKEMKEHKKSMSKFLLLVLNYALKNMTGTLKKAKIGSDILENINRGGT